MSTERGPSNPEEDVSRNNQEEKENEVAQRAKEIYEAVREKLAPDDFMLLTTVLRDMIKEDSFFRSKGERGYFAEYDRKGKDGEMKERAEALFALLREINQLAVVDR